MTWFPLPPYWMPVSGSASDNYKESIFAGRDVTIIETIAGALNFSIHLVPFRGTVNWMVPLRTREALLRPIILPIMPHMLEEFDITFFIEPNTLAFSLAKPTLKPTWQSLFYPLQAEVWGSVAVTVLVVFVVLLKMKPEDDKSQGAWLVMKQVVGTLLDEPIHGEMPQRSSKRMVLTAWMIFSFIVGTVYRSNLTACLTVPTYPVRAEDLADLVDMGIKVTILPEMVMFYQSFKESGNDVLVSVAESMEYVPTYKEGLRRSITENKAHLYERLYLELKIAEHFTDEDGSTPLYVTQRNFMPGYSTFILTRNNPFKINFDDCILKFHEAGLIRKWTTDIKGTMKRGIMKDKGESMVEVEEEKNEEAESILALTLVHMQGPFFIYAASVTMSLIVFLFENISIAYHKI
ncbi:uncharacterized protein LOC135108643 [Scylla paramamosain]|uniref:uncharacterized protein LOC135108643 n=1 Tax=Scylla paramamosain TaxID=85552 RepID=UPI003083137F